MEGRGPVHRVEVFALEVLDQGPLGELSIVEFSDDRGDLWQPRELGGAPPAFAGDQFIGPRFAVASRLLSVGMPGANDHGLHQAVGLDRVRQRPQGPFRKDLPRLERVGDDRVDREVLELVIRGLFCSTWNTRVRGRGFGGVTGGGAFMGLNPSRHRLWGRLGTRIRALRRFLRRTAARTLAGTGRGLLCGRGGFTFSHPTPGSKGGFTCGTSGFAFGGRGFGPGGGGRDGHRGGHQTAQTPAEAGGALLGCHGVDLLVGEDG